jgi:hypothetical protein
MSRLFDFTYDPARHGLLLGLLPAAVLAEISNARCMDEELRMSHMDTFGPLRWCAAHLHERWTEADGVLCPRCLAEEIAAARSAGEVPA